MKNAQKDYFKLENSRFENEISLDILPYENEQLSVVDEYFADEYIFDVLGALIPTGSEIMAKTISRLPELQRNIVLLYCLAELTEKDIAQKLGISRREVSYQKQCALEKLKSLYEEEEEKNEKQ